MRIGLFNPTAKCASSAATISNSTARSIHVYWLTRDPIGIASGHRRGRPSWAVCHARITRRAHTSDGRRPAPEIGFNLPISISSPEQVRTWSPASSRALVAPHPSDVGPHPHRPPLRRQHPGSVATSFSHRFSNHIENSTTRVALGKTQSLGFSGNIVPIPRLNRCNTAEAKPEIPGGRPA